MTPSRRRFLAGVGVTGLAGGAGCAGGDGGGESGDAGNAGGSAGGAAGSADTAVETDGETTVRIGIATGGWDLLPPRDTDFDSNKVYTLLSDNVVNLDADAQVVPDLATDWRRESDTQYVFELEEGVTFHNGERFTAADVEYTYDWIQTNENPRRSDLAAVEDVVVEDDRTVRFDLSEPFAPLLYKIHAVMWPLSKTAIDEHGEAYNQNPVGTGPFELTEWESGNRAVLEAYDDYWRGRPAIDRIEFRILPEDSSKVAQLETGDVDLVDRMPPQFTERVEAAGNARVITTTGVSAGRVDFNTDVEPLGDRRVRRALAWAIDKERIVETVSQGFGTPGTSILPDSFPQYNDAISDFNHPTGDTERARALLAEAGYGDGLSLEIKTSTQSRHRRTATLVQAMWSEVGVDAEIQSLDGNTFWSQETSGDFEVAVSNFTWFGDPDTLLYLYHSEGLNVWNIANDDLDALLDDQRRAVDPEARAELIDRIQRLTYEEAYSIYTDYPQRIQGISTRISGFEQYPNGSFRSLDGASVE
jgi:peptide/nickel transport system substrate-binding protein